MKKRENYLQLAGKEDMHMTDRSKAAELRTLFAGSPIGFQSMYH